MRLAPVILAAALSIAICAPSAAVEAAPMAADFLAAFGQCAGGANALAAGDGGAAEALPFAPEQPVLLTHCTAQQNCANGLPSPISCSGHTSCNVGLCSVRCDGQTTWCCDLSELECPQRACVYCACIGEGIFSPSECSEQACSTLGDRGGGD